jgi:hypothetical protein
LHAPKPARLVTGLKRDIVLLERVQAVAGDALLVCDISLRRNRLPLLRLLEAGVSVRYFDHHAVDAMPVHPLLNATIDVASDTCTSLLVDRYLQGRFRAWAVVGAFGDNLTEVADRLAVSMGLSLEGRRGLQTLGESINYNAYGDSEMDVHIPPAALYARMVQYPDPLVFWARDGIGQELAALRQADLKHALTWPPDLDNSRMSVCLLPNAPWSRRVSGSLINLQAAADPLRAHALLTSTDQGDFSVSVRAPLCAPVGAAEFCRPFGGDGRAGAAGIDQLPAAQLDRFMVAFSSAPWGG